MFLIYALVAATAFCRVDAAAAPPILGEVVTHSTVVSVSN